ncbi:hypothetical protein Tco_0382292, partial [Tanacetum coccineum]
MGSESDSGSDDLVRSIENKHEEKTITQQRNIFPNLSIKDANENESKKVTKRSNDWDSLNGNKNRVGNLRSTDDVSPVIKIPNTFKEELVSHKFEEPDIIPSVTRSKFKERDIFEDNFKSAQRTKDVLVDDPLAVQAQSLCVLSNSQLRTQDVLMVSENTYCQETMAAWNPDMESETSYQKIVKLDFVANDKSTKSRTKTLVGKGLERKGTTIEAKLKALFGSRSKKSTATKTTIPKGKSKK